MIGRMTHTQYKATLSRYIPRRGKPRPKKVKRQAPIWNVLSDSAELPRTVQAFTKSEVRARLKNVAGWEHLPEGFGALIVKAA